MKTRTTQIVELKTQVDALSEAIEAAQRRTQSEALDRFFANLHAALPTIENSNPRLTVRYTERVEAMAGRVVEGTTTPEDDAIIASLNADDVAACGMSINEFFGAMYRLSEKY